MKELLKAKAEFRRKGIVLVADKTKSGGGGSWKFAGEDNLIKTIQKPLTECGLEVISTMAKNSVNVTLFHVESGECLVSSIDLSEVTPRKDKNGNDMYLDAEIERGKQFGYWSRILTIRLLGLSDIDPEDTNNRPTDISSDTAELKKELNSMIQEASDPIKTGEWVLKTYKVASLLDLTSEQLKHVIKLIKQKSVQEKKKTK